MRVVPCICIHVLYCLGMRVAPCTYIYVLYCLGTRVVPCTYIHVLYCLGMRVAPCTYIHVLSRYESSPVYIYLCTVLSRYESSPVYKMNTSQMHANLQEEYNSPEWQRALQTLNLSLEEVAHIRSVLTKAELEVGLQFTNC